MYTSLSLYRSICSLQNLSFGVFFLILMIGAVSTFMDTHLQIVTTHSDGTQEKRYGPFYLFFVGIDVLLADPSYMTEYQIARNQIVSEKNRKLQFAGCWGLPRGIGGGGEGGNHLRKCQCSEDKY